MVPPGVNSVFSAALEKPYDPVSWIDGKNAARATLMSKFAATSRASASATSGRRCSSAGGQAGRDRRQRQVVERAGPHRDRLGRAADQDAETDQLLLELVAQVGDRRPLAGHQRFLLRHVERAGGAGVEPAADHRQRLFGIGQVALRDGQPVRQRQRGEPGVGDVGHHRQRDHLLVEPAEHGAGMRRTAGAARFLPQKSTS